MDNLPLSIKEMDSKSSSIYDAFSATIDNIAEMIKNLLMLELKKTLEEKQVRVHVKEGIALYIYTAGFLSLAGREVTRYNLSKFASLLGSEPDEQLIDVLLKSGVKSHLAYLYAYYFLLTSGKDASIDQILQVMQLLDLPADRARAAEAIRFVDSQLGRRKIRLSVKL
ncbi:MAG: hypothetical protein KGH61_05190 [Candidatus Micrarchaeota archaeon]|nr:hypothetical protein [Candidatus Micrarchaeota archaeon]MDE1848309.1 hypothetical protein [Candidatus Micrarchaeota archaeon]